MEVENINDTNIPPVEYAVDVTLSEPSVLRKDMVSTFTSVVERLEVEMLKETDIPPVEYTVDVTTSQQSVLRNDMASTFTSEVERLEVKTLKETDIPPVAYTVDVTTSQQSVLRNAMASTFTSEVERLEVKTLKETDIPPVAYTVDVTTSQQSVLRNAMASTFTSEVERLEVKTLKETDIPPVAYTVDVTTSQQSVLRNDMASTFTSEVERLEVKTLKETDIPPVAYTVDVTTSQQSVLRNDMASTFTSEVERLEVKTLKETDIPPVAYTVDVTTSQQSVLRNDMASTFTSVVERLEVKTLKETDIPPVAYTVDVTTSQQSVLRNDMASTFTSEVERLELRSGGHLYVLSTSSASDVPLISTQKHTIIGSKKEHCIPKKGLSNKNRRKEVTRSGNVVLSPRKKKLLKKLKKYKLKLKNIKQKAKLFDNIKSKALKTMLLSASKNQNRRSQGKRWSENDKVLAIAMYKKSPKLYRYLRHLLPLPSSRTLQTILSKMPIQPGFNKIMMNHLKRKANELSLKDKTCVIMFDEISLKKRLIYNPGNDKVEGYQDLGEHGRTKNLADKALVLLLQGVHKKYKQPLAHYFVKGTISAEKLVAIINNAIKIVSELGFKVIATVCDQGPTNIGALNLLKKFTGQPPDSNFFLVDNSRVYIIYDVPHLFKSIRNNFYEGGVLVFDKMKAKWSHLVELQEKNKETLHFKKITPLHVNPKFRAKMKVKLAAQILSNDVAAILKLFAETFGRAQEVDGSLKRDAVLQTANVIQQLDQLFDLTNGPASKKDVKKGIRVNVSKNSIHHKLWPEFKTKIKTMHFLRSDSQLRLRNVRCVNGYYTTISSLQDIWKYVQSIGFKFLNLRQLNQDALENLFGLIRQHSPTNQNPTCHHFTAALKTTILTKLSTPIRGANCAVDDNQLMLDFHDLVFQNSATGDMIDADHSYVAANDVDKKCDYSFCDDDDPVLHLPDIETDVEESLFETFDKQPVVYVSGYLASVLVKGTNCNKCCDSVRTMEPGNDKIYKYIALKEWWTDKLSLTYPTLNLCNTVDTCVSVFERDVKPNLHYNDIIKYCCLMMSKEVNASWLCEDHNSVFMDTMLNKLSALLIRNECRKINLSISEKEQLNADKNKIAQLQSSAK